MSNRLYGPFPNQVSQSPTLIAWVGAAIWASVSVAALAVLGSPALVFVLSAVAVIGCAATISWLNRASRREWRDRFDKLRARRDTTQLEAIGDADGLAHIAGTVTVVRPAADSDDLAAWLTRKWGSRRVRKDRLHGQSAYDMSVLRQERACGAFWVHDSTGSAWIDPWEDGFEMLCDEDDPLTDHAATLRDGDAVEIIGVARALSPDEARTRGLEQGAGYRLAQPTVAFDDRQSTTLLVLPSSPARVQR